MNDQQKPQISNIAAFAIITVSVLFDIVQLVLDFIPVVGWLINMFIDLLAVMTFYVWFKILGISFVRARRALIFASGFILDAIPFTSWFAWTLDVVLVIGDVRGQELLKKIAPNTAKKLQKVQSSVS